MVAKDVDSVMTCGAVLAQMPKGEKHFVVCLRLIVDVCIYIYNFFFLPLEFIIFLSALSSV